MIVAVTVSHISKGSRNSNLHNPIAIALQKLDKNDHVVVTPTRVHRLCPHPRVPGITPCQRPWCGVVTLPEYARQWLEQYNANRCNQPFQFTL
jgi:hypothetical protein